MSYAINHYWPLQRLCPLEDVNDNEILRNLKNGICNVVLLNVTDIPDFSQASQEHKPKGGEK
jgi:hypothetical protein